MNNEMAFYRDDFIERQPHRFFVKFPMKAMITFVSLR